MSPIIFQPKGTSDFTFKNGLFLGSWILENLECGFGKDCV